MSSQDVQDEVYRQRRNYFLHFLETEGGYGDYSERIQVMVNEGTSRLIVDLNDLRSYDSTISGNRNTADNIVHRLLQNPIEYIPPFEEAIQNLASNLDNTYGNTITKQQVNTREYRLGFDGSFGHNEVTPRGLGASLLCQMVCVCGIVTKCSAVRPKVVKSVHYCPATNKTISREYRDSTSLTGLPTPSVYPTKDENGNLLETEFGLCSYKDYQVVTMQEMPESAPHGQMPRSVDLILEHDMVDKCKPGDRIQVVGCYRALAGNVTGSTSGVFKTVILTNNLQLLGKEVHGIVMTTEDLANVRELAQRQDIFQVLSRSIAPSIFGHQQIKQAILLQLLGGVEKNLENGTHLRGDINILMVGDPSTAKSQLLRFVCGIVPLAVNTTGKGSSGVGLTAAVTTDTETGERRLEAGAMVLADRGVVCIDEFDKMSEADRVAIHEVMEQQTVTIAKAGIHATLNARCSVLAAANPVWGQYNKNKKPQENIGLPDSLLSRFDLLFVVLDKLDRETDRKISDHVLRLHRYQKPGQEGIPLSLGSNSAIDLTEDDNDGQIKETPVWLPYNPLLHGNLQSRSNSSLEILSMEFLKKYIHYAKTRFSPVLTDAAIETISQGYAEIRGEQDARTFPVTARTLETLIRLATAHAKCRLSQKIERQDADKAMELLQFALYHESTVEKHLANQQQEENDEDEDNTLTVHPKRNVSSLIVAREKEEGSDEEDDLSLKSSTTKKSKITNTSRKEMVQCKLNEIRPEDDQIQMMELLEALNENLSKSNRFSEEELAKICIQLEKENRIVFEKVNKNLFYV